MGRPITAYDTAARILDVAEGFVQTRGFNGFSYADVAAALDVTKASLHYHFATKAVLGASLIARYRTSFEAALARIDAEEMEAGAKLLAYAGIYVDVLKQGRMCLCGMLAAEFQTLPAAMQAGVRGFFDANEAWLVGVLAAGRERQELAFEGAPAEVAGLLVGALEGGMLLARARGDVALLERVAARLVAGLVAPAGVEVGSLTC